MEHGPGKAEASAERVRQALAAAYQMTLERQTGQAYRVTYSDEERGNDERLVKWRIPQVGA